MDPLLELARFAQAELQRLAQLADEHYTHADGECAVLLGNSIRVAERRLARWLEQVGVVI